MPEYTYTYMYFFFLSVSGKVKITACLCVCCITTCLRLTASCIEFVTAVEGCIDFVYCIALQLFGGQDHYSCDESS